MRARQTLELRPLHLNDVVREANDLMIRSFSDASVACELRAPTSDLPRIVGDKSALQQVLLNLILNAIDAMKDVPVTKRRLTLSTSPAGPHEVALAASDSGHGLSEQAQKHLFDSFFTTKPTGLGLGLTIVRSIVEAHGGQLAALNNEGAGATIRVTLRLGAEDTGQSREGVLGTSTSSIIPIVRVVDDDDDLREAVAVLRVAGYQVRTYADAGHFLLLGCHVRSGLPAVRCADVSGGPSGLDLQEALAERRSPLPVIFLSGQADVPMCARAFKAGALDFLTEPIRKDELLAAVARAIERDRETRRAEQTCKRCPVSFRSLSEREKRRRGARGREAARRSDRRRI